MTVRDLLDRVAETFAVHPRPLVFTNTDHCSECAEHNQTLAGLQPESLQHEDVGQPGWDPFTFATPEAYLYFFPGLARLAATGSGASFYLDRFAGQLHNRVDLLTLEERQLALDLLWRAYSGLQDSPDLHEQAVHDIDSCLRQLERSLKSVAGDSASS